MSTRITQSMLNNNMLYNLQRSESAMDKLQNQAASGKKINRPSDDPVAAVRSMYYRSSLNDIDQYQSNANDGTSWLTTTDNALDEVNSVLQRVRELTVQGLNGTNDGTDRSAIADEIEQLKDHLGEVANTQIGDNYIFAGTDTKNPPYRADPSSPDSAEAFVNNNQGKIEFQVGQTNTVQVNVNGTDVFNNDGNGGLFKVLSDLVSDFRNPDSSPSDDSLSQLDSQINNVLSKRSEVGARMNRLDLSSSRLDELETSTTDLLSKEEDVDISQVIIDLKSQENVHQAALSIGANVIQTSLVDFLK